MSLSLVFKNLNKKVKTFKIDKVVIFLYKTYKKNKKARINHQ